MIYPPCKNPNCKSYGKPHPNCKCYAQGGCVGPHDPGCSYFLEGGQVQSSFHHDKTLGHAGITHGLLGLMQNIGKAKMAEPDKHEKMLRDTRDAHKFHSEGIGPEPKSGMHSKLAKHVVDQDHEGAAELMHGHPLVGSGKKETLKHVMEYMGPSLMSNEPNPQAMRGTVDYLQNAARGQDLLKSEMSKLFEKQKVSDRISPDKNARQALKDHLMSVAEDPSQLLDVGGDIGHYAPEHATALGAMAATASSYLDSIKPKQFQLSPMDKVAPPDKGDVAQYDRQIDIAQNPRLVIQHLRDGTLISQDLLTVKSIYPALFDSMANEASEALISAKTKGMEIPYKQRQTLSMLLGQPLDLTMTPVAMQAIIKSASAQQSQNQIAKQTTPKATSVEMNAIEKTDELSETPLEARMIKKVSK